MKRKRNFTCQNEAKIKVDKSSHNSFHDLVITNEKPADGIPRVNIFEQCKEVISRVASDKSGA